MKKPLYFNYIEEKLNFLASRINARGKLNLLDLHIHSENFYAQLLNKLYSWNLVNLNSSEQNSEAIDLIDHNNKIIVQVSATNTKQKIENSLKKIVKDKYVDYSFKFLSIAKDASNLRKIAFNNPSDVIFDPQVDILDINSILKDINSLKTDKMEEFYEFIKFEFESKEEIEQWYQANPFKLAIRIIFISIILAGIFWSLIYVSNLDGDTTKFVLSLLNLLVSLVFCLALYKSQELKFKDDDALLKYWEKLDIQSVKNSEGKIVRVEIDNKEEDAIREGRRLEIRVNRLVEQFIENIQWFAFILFFVYLIFIFDNPKVLSYFGKENLLEEALPILRVFEDISNFGNSIFIFLGFMVLYDITLTKDNNRKRYFMPVLITFILCIVTYFVVIYPSIIKFYQPPDTVIENIKISLNKEKDNSELIKIRHWLENQSMPQTFELKTELIGRLKALIENVSIINVANNASTECINESDKANLNCKLLNLSKIINNPDDKIKINLAKLIIGCFNGLAFALLFSRYISMEHQLWKLKGKKYHRYIQWAAISVLPIYALVQPLFGSFDIDVFGSPKHFTNIVFFICLIGKLFFFYITWIFLERKLLHYCLHLALVKHGVPDGFDECFS